MSFLSKIFSSKNSIKNGGSGTFFGKLIRGAASSIPIVGGVVGGALNAAAEVKMANVQAQKAAEQMAAQPATVENVMSNAGMPNVSSVFPNGSNPTSLNDVQVSANRIQSTPVNTDFNLDWKNGTISSSSGQGSDSKMLLYGLLGLGAFMVLKQK